MRKRKQIVNTECITALLDILTLSKVENIFMLVSDEVMHIMNCDANKVLLPTMEFLEKTE